MNRKFHNIVWLAILIPLSLEAADNPFVGTWRSLEDKMQLHNTYKFIRVGDKSYQTDNGVGLGPVLPTDGSVHESPLGGMVSLKQIDAKTFLYVLKRSTTYRRTMTIDGDTMKWDEDQELASGKHETAQSIWRRNGQGAGLTGTWKSVSRKSGEGPETTRIREISDGISLEEEGDPHPENVHLDGKEHASDDPDDIKGILYSSVLVDKRTIRTVETKGGKKIMTITLSISADGKLMTSTVNKESGEVSSFMWERVN